MSIYSEYIIIQDEAIKSLREANEVYELQILSLKTFDYPTAYYICRNDNQNNGYTFFVYQWNKYFDLEITQNPLVRLKYTGQILIPTIIKRKIENPDKEKIENLLTRFLDLNIPYEVKKSGFAIDGTTYEVSLFNQPFQNKSRYIWQNNAPDEWKDLEILMNETIELFREESKLKGWIYI